MALASRPFTLPDGRGARVREARLRDSRQLARLQRLVLAEPDRFVAEPDEYEGGALEMYARIRRRRRAVNSLLLVAECAGRLLGVLDFQGGLRRKERHRGSVCLAVAPDSRRQGVGRALLETLFAWARQTAAVEKVTLAVFAHNEPALAFYRALGFVEEGRRRREYRTADGRYLDDLLLACFTGGRPDAAAAPAGAPPAAPEFAPKAGAPKNDGG